MNKFSANDVTDIETLRQSLYQTGEKKDFIHLHLHSDFSLKDGIGKPTQYAKKAIEIGMSALGITDHGSIGAHPSFFIYCRSNNLKPIVGVEMYLQDRRLEVKEFDVHIKQFDEKIKVLKHACKHKKATHRNATDHISYYNSVLKLPNLTVDELIAMDYTEVKEQFEEEYTRLQVEQDKLTEDRDSLKRNRHIVLLAKNERGRKNITKIVSNAAREGFYYKPRTSFTYMKDNKEGIIVSSACLLGPINNAILKDEDDVAAKARGMVVAKQYQEAFGEDFYIEIMVIDIDKQRRVNKILLEIAKELSIKFIVTNDVHYVDQKGAKAQEISLMLGSKDDGGQQVTMKDKRKLNAMKEILTAIGENVDSTHVRKVYNDFMSLDRFVEFRQTNDTTKMTITLDEIVAIVSGEKKFKRVWEFSTKDFWFKDRHQMIDAYIDQGHYKYISVDDFKTALDNTLEVAKKVDSWNWDSKEKLPKITNDDGLSSYDYMVAMTRDGWRRKAEDSWYEPDSIYAKRVKYELSVVRRTEMADYFVIVADYIKHAKNNGCVCGAGRGCFLPTVNKVKMADGSMKEIENVNTGDIVANKFWGESKVKDHFIYDVDEDMIELEFENETIQCTLDHRFFTKNRGEVKAVDLTDEDEILYECD
ncbi:MAG: PHP domain-containing protein [Nitrosarchaeum sp.]|nr:PHP domain-containing protein [Nitrosarchaeum sp.]